MKTHQSKIEKLIAELCPNGVEFRELGKIADIGTGSSNGNEAVENGKYPEAKTYGSTNYGTMQML